jgi:uncharacterized RDD family membrane protein YckC
VELEDRITIGAPEGIELHLQLAGAASRGIARAFDDVLKFTLIVLLLIGVHAIGGEAREIADAFLIVAVFAIVWFYDVFFEVMAQGRTPGKRATHLRVVREQGAPVDLMASLVRNLVRVIEEWLLLGLPALISISLTKHNQRLGDLAADTIVVRDAQAPEARWDGFAQATERAGDDGAATTSGWDLSAVSAAEFAVIRRFLERRGTLERSARRELAYRLEQGLRAKVAGAPPADDPERFLEALAQAKAGR